MKCINCGESEYPVERRHVHLDSGQVVEIDLCEGCRHKFVISEWVEGVL